MSGKVQCVAVLGGKQCEGESYRDSMPIPICFDHAFSIYLDIHREVGGHLKSIHRRMEEESRGITAEDQAIKEAYAEQSQVYYIRIGDHVKIGYTQNLLERIGGLRVDASDVLATEPGGREKERERHLQFAHLRVGRRENFERTADLLTHIARVRREHGKPKMTGYVGVGASEEARRKSPFYKPREVA